MPRQIMIIGAGAAGMMAAITAARAGASVTILEAMDRPGKKLLVTGNGRCNLTNTNETLPDQYYGTGAGMASQVITRFDASDTIRFFETLGLWTMEKNGYVYPCTAQSSAVLEVLLGELRRLKVKMKYTEKVCAIVRLDGRWKVQTGTWQYPADAVILTAGSKAVSATGSDGSGYALAASQGHRIVTPAPALVPILCKGDYFGALAGVRCRASVSLFQKRGAQEIQIKEETGELQWTKYGVSGIVIFQLSRFVAADPNGQYFLQVNLLPGMDFSALAKQLSVRAKALAGEKVSVLFAGLLHSKLIPHILKTAGIAQKLTCADLNEARIGQILSVASNLTIAVSGTRGFEECQVCSGGIDCREISADTMESRKAKGLYFAGEIVDVDGPCGGYNLQWAWSSGHAAGSAAAQEA